MKISPYKKLDLLVSDKLKRKQELDKARKEIEDSIKEQSLEDEIVDIQDNESDIPGFKVYSGPEGRVFLKEEEKKL